MKMFISQVDGNGASGTAFRLLLEDGTEFPNIIQAASIHHAHEELAVLDLSLVVNGENLTFGTPALEPKDPAQLLTESSFVLNGVRHWVDMTPAEAIKLMANLTVESKYKFVATEHARSRAVNLLDPGDGLWKSVRISGPDDSNARQLEFVMNEHTCNDAGTLCIDPFAELIRNPKLRGAIVQDKHISFVVC